MPYEYKILITILVALRLFCMIAADFHVQSIESHVTHQSYYLINHYHGYMFRMSLPEFLECFDFFVNQFHTSSWCNLYFSAILCGESLKRMNSTRWLFYLAFDWLNLWTCLLGFFWLAGFHCLDFCEFSYNIISIRQKKISIECFFKTLCHLSFFPAI